MGEILKTQGAKFEFANARLEDAVQIKAELDRVGRHTCNGLVIVIGRKHTPPTLPEPSQMRKSGAQTSKFVHTSASSLCAFVGDVEGGWQSTETRHGDISRCMKI